MILPINIQTFVGIVVLFVIKPAEINEPSTYMATNIFRADMNKISRLRLPIFSGHAFINKPFA